LSCQEVEVFARNYGRLPEEAMAATLQVVAWNRHGADDEKTSLETQASDAVEYPCS
jgi:hypothetical protein